MPIVIGVVAGGPLDGAPATQTGPLRGGGFAVRLLVAKGAHAEGDPVRLGAGEFVAQTSLEPRFVAVLERMHSGRPLVRADFVPLNALWRAGLVEMEGPGRRWVPSALGRALVRVRARTRGPNVRCALCGTPGPEDEAHWHEGGWIGDACCWDERLKASE